ncbi:hypothetical protein D3C72_1337110 [compost metagenome]
MAVYSSCSQQCFLDDRINPLPEDAHPLTSDEHQLYLEGQVAGKIIDFSTCPPSLIERPALPIEQLAEIERVWRDALLLVTDGVVARHRDELEEGIATTLTGEHYRELQAYRRVLRDWPQGAEFPLVDHRPIPPIWLIPPRS